MVKHIVMWKLKNSAEGNTKEVNALIIKERLEGLKDKVSELQSIEVGINIEKSAQAYDIILYTEFKNEEDLNSYQINQYHVEIANFVRSVVESRVVADYIV